jgi:AcrR family transcriptional regulator
VAAESAMPVSTLQYYFGSREDLLVAAFRHASSTEIAALEAELAALEDPWDRLTRIAIRALASYGTQSERSGELWIESWHFGIRDAEMRADTLRDYAAWRRLIAEAVRPGLGSGQFRSRHSPGRLAVLILALLDGVGIPLALGDPEITTDATTADVMSAIAEMLHHRAARA